MEDRDLTPEAVDRRLRALSDLYELGMTLKTARILGPVERAAHEPQGSVSGHDPMDGTRRRHEDTE